MDLQPTEVTMTGILADIPVDLPAEEFIAEFDRKLDRAVLDAAKRATAEPWETLDKQLIVGASQAWGETRSAETFARQILKLKFDHPELRSAMTKINQDEPFHVSIGRMAARALLCRQGEGIRRRMVELATESLPFTLGSMEGVSLRMVTM